MLKRSASLSPYYFQMCANQSPEMIMVDCECWFKMSMQVNEWKHKHRQCMNTQYSCNFIMKKVLPRRKSSNVVHSPAPLTKEVNGRFVFQLNDESCSQEHCLAMYIVYLLLVSNKASLTWCCIRESVICIKYNKLNSFVTQTLRGEVFLFVHDIASICGW